MVKNSAQRIVFPILDADGDPVTGAASDTPDSEYSLDGASFADCNDEIHEIATASGIYYLDLLTGETNGDVVVIQVKTATAGTKTTVLVFYTSTQSLDTVNTAVNGIQVDLSNATDGLGALKALLDAIPTTPMRGTDNAALASAWTAALATALGNYNATRAGYLDNLSAGAVALEVTLTAMKGSGWSDETLKAIRDAIRTRLRL